MISAVLLALAATSLTSLVSAQGGPVSSGCVSSVPTKAQLVPFSSYGPGSGIGGGTGNNFDCAFYCGGVGSAAAYYQPGTGGANPLCYCGNAPAISTYVSLGTYVLGSGPGTTDTSAYISCSATTYQTFVPEIDGTNIKDFVYCVNPAVFQAATTSAMQTSASASSCVAFCGVYAVFYPQIGTGGAANTGTCYCYANPLPTAGAQTSNDDCKPGDAGYYYANSATPGGASAHAKRRDRERLARSKNQPEYCPKGLTPCLVKNQPNAYECLDTSNELESCGGCLWGEYKSKSVLKGVDCSAVAGVPLGAMTCEAGICQASSCEDGFTLSSGHCFESE